jgi:hypothetical protein
MPRHNHDRIVTQLGQNGGGSAPPRSGSALRSLGLPLVVSIGLVVSLGLPLVASIGLVVSMG